MELRIDGENYLKLAYIGKEFYQTAIKNIKPGLNAEVFGHHVKAFPFDSSKAQQYSELGLFKITKMFFFSNRFTDELETKEDFLAIRRKKNQKHSNNKNINKRNQR